MKILMVKIANIKLKIKPNKKSIENEIFSVEIISTMFKVMAADMTGIESKSENLDAFTLL